MRGERQVLRAGEYLLGRACARLPAEMRDERYREWAAELPAILHDPGVRGSARRAVRMLAYAAGTIRGTARKPGKARRLVAVVNEVIISPATFVGGVAFLVGWLKTPQDFMYFVIGCFLGKLIMSGASFAFRRKRGKSPGDELDELMETLVGRVQTRARARARSLVQARASAGPAISTAGHAAGSFPRSKLGPGYRTAEVDDLVARIEATLRGTVRPGQEAVTAADVQAAKFRTARHRGYNERVVDEVLDYYADELDRAAPSPPAPAVGG